MSLHESPYIFWPHAAKIMQKMYVELFKPLTQTHLCQLFLKEATLFSAKLDYYIIFSPGVGSSIRRHKSEEETNAY